MTPIQEVQTKLFAAHARLHSWRQVGVEFGITAGMAYRIAHEGHEPKDPVIRGRLGLPSMFAVQGLAGTVIEGGAIIGVNSRTCIKRTCNVEFIPNTPIRRKCYYCSPVRSTIPKQ